MLAALQDAAQWLFPSNTGEDKPVPSNSTAKPLVQRFNQVFGRNKAHKETVTQASPESNSSSTVVPQLLTQATAPVATAETRIPTQAVSQPGTATHTAQIDQLPQRQSRQLQSVPQGTVQLPGQLRTAPEGGMQQPDEATPLHMPDVQLQSSSAMLPWYAQHAPQAESRPMPALPSVLATVPFTTPEVSEAMQKRSGYNNPRFTHGTVPPEYSSTTAPQLSAPMHKLASASCPDSARHDSISPAQLSRSSAGPQTAYTATRSSSDTVRNPLQLDTASLIMQHGARHTPQTQLTLSTSSGEVQQATPFDTWNLPISVTPQQRQDSMAPDHSIDISTLTAAQSSNHTPLAGSSYLQQQPPHARQHSSDLSTAQSAPRSELAQQVPFYESSPQYTAVQAPAKKSVPAKAVDMVKGYLNIRMARPAVQQNTDGGTIQPQGADLESNGAVQASGCSPKSALLRSAIFPGGQGGSGVTPEQAERRAKGLVRTRVEPKVFFANERTFLQWLQISVLLMFTGLSLLGGVICGQYGRRWGF